MHTVTSGIAAALVKGSVFGAAIGDALGFPFEFMRRRQINALVSGGPTDYYELSHAEKGEASDDTYMSIAVIEGIKAKESVNLEVTQQRFADWMHSDRFLPSVPGIATTQALRDCSPVPSEGNGACMKSHISALFIEDIADAIQHGIRVAKLTHLSQAVGHNEVAVALVVLATKYALSQPEAPTLEGFIEFARPWITMLDQAAQDFFEENLTELRNIDLDSTESISGWSVGTSNYAIRIWLNSPYDFLQSVRMAVLLGGDTDTVASVVGGIAGAFVGFDKIPTHLVEPLNVREELLSLLEM